MIGSIYHQPNPRRSSNSFAVFLALGLAGGFLPSDALAVATVDLPPAGANRVYGGNRAPLQASKFVKLPIGSITPRGWLRGQLELEAAGMTGHLPEISKWCKFEGSAWSDPNGQGQNGWEELPYWLKGFGDLGYVLKDDRIKAEARKWIDAMLASQEADGYFGPRANKTSLEGKPDLWPHMVMLNVLQSFYEATADPRVLPFMTRYCKWLDSQPPEAFGRGYWPKLRFGDNIESVYWLYNRTGEAWLLGLGKKIHDNMGRWDTGVVNWHNVNIAQGFREPAVYFLQSGDAKHLRAAENNYRAVMDLYGQFPGGGFVGDENCRPGYTDPRGGIETCGIVEFMHSFEMLTRISGETVWADRCEELAFNSLPAAMMPDLKGLHYLTCANQVRLDWRNKSPGVQNEGTMLSYSPGAVYRCCQHNVSHGWPYYAEELWLATADGGLCASLYANSEVKAGVGEGGSVRISEETDYPFSETIRFKVSTANAIQFPLYLRVPGWCEGATVKLNGKTLNARSKASSYLVIDRTWQDSDTLTLKLPMKLAVRRWEKNSNAASVHLGPLAFSLQIQEQWRKYGGLEAWPDWEVLPTSAWNYGLVLEGKSPERSLKIVRSRDPVARQPFTMESAPIRIEAKARKIAAWKEDANGLVGKLQASPVKSAEPVETVTLIPLGAARLRIGMFPVIGTGPGAVEWMEPKAPAVSASHCFDSDTVEALIDGKEPTNSHDRSIPRFTWWDHRGSAEWIQRSFEAPRTISSVAVYWFDDTGAGSCRVPKSWKVLYQRGAEWVETEGASGYPVNLDSYSRVSFKPVETSAVRVEVQLQTGFSGGDLEWKVE